MSPKSPSIALATLAATSFGVEPCLQHSHGLERNVPGLEEIARGVRKNGLIRNATQHSF